MSRDQRSSLRPRHFSWQGETGATVLPGRAGSQSECSAGPALSSVVRRAQVAAASYANDRFDRSEETRSFDSDPHVGDEVMAALGQAGGVDGADAGRSAGDQRETLGILAHLSVS